MILTKPQNIMSSSLENNTFKVLLFFYLLVFLQPLIVPYAILQLFLYYWIQKIVLYKICKRPTPGNNVINTAMYQRIFLRPLMYTIGNMLWCNILRYCA